LRELEIKIKSLQHKVQETREKIDNAQKEYNFKKDFIKKDVEKELADYQPDGLGVTLPKASAEDLQVSDEQITEALQSMYKLAS
jgi:predicted oxidoreductase